MTKKTIEIKSKQPYEDFNDPASMYISKPTEGTPSPERTSEIRDKKFITLLKPSEHESLRLLSKITGESMNQVIIRLLSREFEDHSREIEELRRYEANSPTNKRKT